MNVGKIVIGLILAILVGYCLYLGVYLVAFCLSLIGLFVLVNGRFTSSESSGFSDDEDDDGDGLMMGPRGAGRYLGGFKQD